MSHSTKIRYRLVGTPPTETNPEVERCRINGTQEPRTGVSQDFMISQVQMSRLKPFRLHTYSKLLKTVVKGLLTYISPCWWFQSVYPLVNVYSLLLKMAIEIVDLPIRNYDCQ